VISQPSRHCTVELQALPSRIGQVRRIVSAQLRYWHLDPLIDRASLGVTELLTNVHRHAAARQVVHRGDRAAARPAHRLGARPRPPPSRGAGRGLLRDLRTRTGDGRRGQRELGCAAGRRVGQGRVVHPSGLLPRRVCPPVRRTARPRSRPPAVSRRWSTPPARSGPDTLPPGRPLQADRAVTKASSFLAPPSSPGEGPSSVHSVARAYPSVRSGARRHATPTTPWRWRAVRRGVRPAGPGAGPRGLRRRHPPGPPPRAGPAAPRRRRCCRTLRRRP
jgi:hypothetical protein